MFHPIGFIVVYFKLKTLIFIKFYHYLLQLFKEVNIKQNKNDKDIRIRAMFNEVYAG
jgi:hypothetical protein